VIDRYISKATFKGQTSSGENFTLGCSSAGIDCYTYVTVHEFDESGKIKTISVRIFISAGFGENIQNILDKVVPSSVQKSELLRISSPEGALTSLTIEADFKWNHKTKTYQLSK
jgi:hypothetical protein